LASVLPVEGRARLQLKEIISHINLISRFEDSLSHLPSLFRLGSKLASNRAPSASAIFTERGGINKKNERKKRCEKVQATVIGINLEIPDMQGTRRECLAEDELCRQKDGLRAGDTKSSS